EKKQVKKPSKKKKKTKKRTATTIHLEIKKELEINGDYNSHRTARSILQKAFDDGFNGKRLTRWNEYFDDYFNQIEQTEIMGSSVRSTYEKKENFTKEIADSTISKLDEENNLMIDIPDLPLDELEEAAVDPVEDKSVEDESGGAVVYGIIGAGQA